MDTLARLESIPLFADLAPDDLARLAQIAIRRTYSKDELLCREDEFGETLYIIDHGEAVLRQTDSRGLERPIAVLKAGEYFGDEALLLGTVYGSSLQAITPLEAICIHKTEFDQLRQERPQIEKQLRMAPLIREQLRTRALPGQEEGEVWLLRRKRHWVALVQSLILPFVIALLSSIVALSLHLLDFEISLPLAILFIAIIPLVMVVWFVLDWWNDFYLVTTQRVLHREKVILLYETWDEAPLERIQQTNILRSALGNIFGFGTLEILTASAQGKMVWTYLRDPEGMRKVIQQQVKSLQYKSQQTAREEIRQRLLQQAGKPAEQQEAPPAAPAPEEMGKKPGLLARLRPSRPLLRLRYEQAGEIVWRKHWLFLLKRIYLALPAFLLLSAAIIFVSVSDWVGAYRLPIFLASLVLWIVSFFWLWWEWEDWRNDIYILTDSKIIDVEKKPLFFAMERREATLDKIQNVALRMPGLLPNILNYGDVLIETAGPTGAFTFNGVSHPAEVRHEIFRRIEEYKAAQQRRDREQRKAELSTWFQVYEEINKSSGQHAAGG